MTRVWLPDPPEAFGGIPDGVSADVWKGGEQLPMPSKGLEDTPIEQGIPAPGSTFRRAEKRVRTVDTDGS